jgi:hypothetical protein
MSCCARATVALKFHPFGWFRWLWVGREFGTHVVTEWGHLVGLDDVKSQCRPPRISADSVATSIAGLSGCSPHWPRRAFARSSAPATTSTGSSFVLKRRGRTEPQQSWWPYTVPRKCCSQFLKTLGKRGNPSVSVIDWHATGTMSAVSPCTPQREMPKLQCCLAQLPS